MANTTYVGLPEFGVPLVIPSDDNFPDVVEAMTARQPAFLPWPEMLPERAAVLSNESGQGIVALSWVWNYTDDGRTYSSRGSNFGSSQQLDHFTGRRRTQEVVPRTIVAGSKRVLTEDGIFGDNYDVLPIPHPQAGGGGGFGMSGSQGRSQDARAEMVLDWILFEDGLFAGPDACGMFETFLTDIDRIQHTAGQAHTLLRDGASEGQVFDLLLPFARAREVPHSSQSLMAMFSNWTIHQLIGARREQLLTWLAEYAQPPVVRIHRP